MKVKLSLIVTRASTELMKMITLYVSFSLVLLVSLWPLNTVNFSSLFYYLGGTLQFPRTRYSVND